jgi:hypothetical protein
MNAPYPTPRSQAVVVSEIAVELTYRAIAGECANTDEVRKISPGMQEASHTIQ